MGLRSQSAWGLEGITSELWVMPVPHRLDVRLERQFDVRGQRALVSFGQNAKKPPFAATNDIGAKLNIVLWDGGRPTSQILPVYEQSIPHTSAPRGAVNHSSASSATGLLRYHPLVCARRRR
jgi:hypothetical protein